MTPAIEIQNLSKIYRKRSGIPTKAVEQLNLSIAPGEVIGLLGANGAGKTTTIKMICGLVEPTSGHVALNGYDVARQRSIAVQQIGAVLEGTRNIYWRLSAWQNLLYFGRLKGQRGAALKQRAQALLSELELWDRRHEPVRDFSRGMQQKVAIACALVADPPIVLLDEPTLGLDVQAARTVKEWIRELALHRGKTVVLTTHQLDMAQELCQRVAIMRQGRLIAEEPISTLLDLLRNEQYELRVEGHLPQDALQLSPQLAQTPIANALTITHENGHSIVSCPASSQEALYDLLSAVQQTGMSLISVQRAEPKLEDVFVHLMESDLMESDLMELDLMESDLMESAHAEGAKRPARLGKNAERKEAA